MKCSMSCILCAWFVLGASVASSQTILTLGAVYPITETDMRMMLQRKADALQHSDAWQRVQTRIRNDAKEAIEHPQAVSGITPAVENRTWHMTPSATLTHPITDAQGRVILPMGYTVYPLHTIALHHRYIFIDAERRKETRWVRQQCWGTTSRLPCRIILTAGRPIELSNRLGVPIYFDQQGKISSSFGIHHTPAVMQQQGEHLLLEEVAL